ncbi:MAG: DUF302 domain-containing protein [Bacteroidales bacterium]|nr:DUF302 domain-containing protein [Bacteroidales bacterium]MCF8404974.1 DUF302 domain-containing protein [Bacteroidales bacterium]
MEYYISKTISEDFEKAIEHVTELLAEEGFGIMTEIDVRATLKKKLDVDFKKYIILGACNPNLALRAFQADDKIGTLLPCNVIVIDQGDGQTEVAAMNASTLMNQIGNPELNVLALEATKRLKRVMDKL